MGIKSIYVGCAYRHKKSGKLYKAVSLGFCKDRDCFVVMYHAFYNAHSLYTRMESSFLEKFELVKYED